MKSRNILFYILILLMVITVVSIVLGYHHFGFTVGFIFSFFALAVGVFFSAKNREFMHEHYHEDYVDRNKK